MKNKKLFTVLFGHVLLFVCFASLMLVMDLHGLPFCPSNMIFKINCPLCGMSRAHVAVLRFDFDEAFRSHPAFPIALPYAWTLVHAKFFKSKPLRIFRLTFTIFGTAALLAVYIYRIVNFGWHFI